MAVSKRTPVVLTCADVRARVNDFTKLHYSVRSFNEDISSRTFQKYFQILDSGKNFFLQEDIDKFAKFEKTLPEVIGRVDCRFITDVYDLFLKRVKESQETIDQILKSTKFDFSVDETIEVDRKKLQWAKNTDELRARWAKQVKFWALGILEAEPASKDYPTRVAKRFAMTRKAIEEKSADDINGLFMNAFTLSLDPHSSYMLPEEQDEFHVQFSLQLVGIGASLTQTEGYTVIENVIPGGPAAKDGRLKKGDKIIGVDAGDGSGMVDVVDMELNKVVSRIRGKKDTPVKLMVLRKDDKGEVKRLNFEMMRDVVKIQDAEAKSDVLTVGTKKIGVLNLPSFYIDYQGAKSEKDFRSSALDFQRELKNLAAKKVDGIVVDLRFNGGGDLSECVKLTGMLIDKGSVVQVANRDNDVESLDDPQSGTVYNGPLLVLISKQSASASEIFAGAIQDYGRGLIVGNSRTYGKGTVQQVIDVPGTHGRESNGALRVTTAKFYRPSGKSNQERGVISDLTIPDILEVSDLGEDENDYVLPYSTINPNRNFKPVNTLSGIVETLKTKSKARVAASKEFKELAEKIAKAEKDKNNTTLSLKLETKKEKDEKKAAEEKAAEPQDGMTVIRKDDIELREAAAILSDSIDVVNKKDWAQVK